MSRPCRRCEGTGEVWRNVPSCQAISHNDHNPDCICDYLECPTCNGQGAVA